MLINYYIDVGQQGCLDFFMLLLNGRFMARALQNMRNTTKMV